MSDLTNEKYPEIVSAINKNNLMRTVSGMNDLINNIERIISILRSTPKPNGVLCYDTIDRLSVWVYVLVELKDQGVDVTPWVKSVGHLDLTSDGFSGSRWRHQYTTSQIWQIGMGIVDNVNVNIYAQHTSFSPRKMYLIRRALRTGKSQEYIDFIISSVP